jgi:hypothetical protein
MLVVDTSLMPLKIIGKEVYLRTKGPSGLLKDHAPKRYPNILRREE